jgi:integral membrane protein
MELLKKFRSINKIEGCSFLILVFIAMPLKYIFGFLFATKIAGMLHGGLFVWFVYSLFAVFKAGIFNKKVTIKFFILSLIPLGSFYTENIIKNRFDTVCIKA